MGQVSACIPAAGEQISALDRQELHLNPGLQYLLCWGSHWDLKLSLLQPHNCLAMQYHSLLLLLIFVTSSC